MKSLVQALHLGNSVAEFDEALDEYFVETEAFRALVDDRVDLVAGDKGTGKTALYRILQRRYTTLPELKKVEVLAGFNPAGNPVFQKLVHERPMSEGQYISIWKAYVLSLVGNWAIELVGDDASEKFAELNSLLTRTGLRAQDDKPQTVFSKIINTVKRYLQPSEATFTFSETGIPIVSTKFEQSSATTEAPGEPEIEHAAALRLLDDCLEEIDVTAWVVLDRLDEAFQGFPAVEIPALRALLRAYLDLLEFPRIRTKLFVRRDLFRKIVGTNFVNLTHVNARKIEIVWDEEDLRSLLCQRIRESAGGNLLKNLGLPTDPTDDAIFETVFPAQIDVGERKPTAWNWMMSRIRDGNHVKPPRNLIDLISKAREAQLRREERSPRGNLKSEPLVEADSIRRALSKLSEERVEDTLLAEAGEASGVVESFRGLKSEHNALTLAPILGCGPEEVARTVKPLLEIGFLEQTGQSYKVPILYRDGLGIIQGKAF